MNEENKLKEVKLENTGKIELPKLDVTQYIGKKSKIEKVTELEGKFGYCVKVESEVVDFYGDDQKELRASIMIGLSKDLNGNIGWGEGTKMDAFLKKYGVEHYKDLVGKEVVIQTKANKEGIEFLTF